MIKTFAQVDNSGNVTSVCQFETTDQNIDDGFVDPTGTITFRVVPVGTTPTDVIESWKWLNGAWSFIGPKPSVFHFWNGTEWQYDIDKARTSKWASIKQQREQKEFGGFVWDGSTFDSDALSQSRIQGGIQLTQIDPTSTVDWTLADNTIRTLTASEMTSVGVALSQHVSSLHSVARGLRAQIEASSTQAELDAITWPV